MTTATRRSPDDPDVEKHVYACSPLTAAVVVGAALVSATLLWSGAYYVNGDGFWAPWDANRGRAPRPEHQHHPHSHHRFDGGDEGEFEGRHEGGGRGWGGREGGREWGGREGGHEWGGREGGHEWGGRHEMRGFGKGGGEWGHGHGPHHGGPMRRGGFPMHREGPMHHGGPMRGGPMHHGGPMRHEGFMHHGDPMPHGGPMRRGGPMHHGGPMRRGGSMHRGGPMHHGSGGGRFFRVDSKSGTVSPAGRPELVLGVGSSSALVLVGRGSKDQLVFDELLGKTSEEDPKDQDKTSTATVEDEDNAKEEAAPSANDKTGPDGLRRRRLDDEPIHWKREDMKTFEDSDEGEGDEDTPDETHWVPEDKKSFDKPDHEPSKRDYAPGKIHWVPDDKKSFDKPDGEQPSRPDPRDWFNDDVFKQIETGDDFFGGDKGGAWDDLFDVEEDDYGTYENEDAGDLFDDDAGWWYGDETSLPVLDVVASGSGRAVTLTTSSPAGRAVGRADAEVRARGPWRFARTAVVDAAEALRVTVAEDGTVRWPEENLVLLARALEAGAPVIFVGRNERARDERRAPEDGPCNEGEESQRTEGGADRDEREHEEQPREQEQEPSSKEGPRGGPWGGEGPRGGPWRSEGEGPRGGEPRGSRGEGEGPRGGRGPWRSEGEGPRGGEPRGSRGEGEGPRGGRGPWGGQERGGDGRGPHGGRGRWGEHGGGERRGPWSDEGRGGPWGGDHGRPRATTNERPVARETIQ